MTTRCRKAIAAAAFALTAAVAAPTMAQEATPWPELMMKMADMNKDGMVSRQEYLDMAAKMWDDKHASMMKTDSTMKAGMMGKSQFMAFARNVFIDPGKIGGN
jgi:predicted secreted protein